MQELAPSVRCHKLACILDTLQFGHCRRRAVVGVIAGAAAASPTSAVDALAGPIELRINHNRLEH